jgi:hypothetical protein
MDTPVIDNFINRYCDFFEKLSPANLHEIQQIFDKEAVFRDPFNHVKGVAAIQRIFEHLLKEYPRTLFKVTEICPQGSTVYLQWTFSPDHQASLQIEGVSRVLFSEQGQALEHRDYWDSASELFSHLPLIGAPTRWLLRQAQACAADQCK